MFSQEIIDYNELTAVKLNNKYKAINQPIFIESKTYQNKVGYHAIIPLFFNDEIYSVLNLGWFANKNDSNVEKIINQFNQKRDVIVYLRFLTSKKNLFVPENNLRYEYLVLN